MSRSERKEVEIVEKMEVINILQDGRRFTAEEWKEAWATGKLTLPDEVRERLVNISQGILESQEAQAN